MTQQLPSMNAFDLAKLAGSKTTSTKMGPPEDKKVHREAVQAAAPLMACGTAHDNAGCEAQPIEIEVPGGAITPTDNGLRLTMPLTISRG